MDKKRCFCCQGLGHIASKCLNKTVVSLVEYQTSVEELDDIEDEEKELLFE